MAQDSPRRVLYIRRLDTFAIHMPPDLIDKKFNEILWRMNTVEAVDNKLEMKLRIAFQEGILAEREYIIKQLTPKIPK